MVKKGDENCLLMTGTIDPSKFGSINVVLSDADIRLKQYETAIEFHINNSVFTSIVFIENSGYPFDVDKFIKLAEQVGKNFEYIYMALSDNEIQEMRTRGKSYGEAALIDYAMKNSKLISNSEYIYKITGRLKLLNSKKIVKTKNKYPNEFIVKRIRRFNRIDPHWGNWNETYFFKISKKDYLAYFSNAQAYCNDYDNIFGSDNTCCIEHVYFDLTQLNAVDTHAFSCYPDIVGIRGSSGDIYDISRLKLFLKNILIRIGYYN